LREGRVINMYDPMFTPYFEHEPLYPIDTVTEHVIEWADEPIDPLNESAQMWEDELESQRTRSRPELAERAGGEGDLHGPGFCENISEAVQYLTHYDLQHQAQDSLEAFD
jgi:hypothetical protein